MTKQLEARPAIFVDRDGTLIEDEDFLADPSKMRVYDFTREALELFRDRGFLIIVITNQSGVARGLLSESDIQSVHAALNSSLSGMIDAYYFCPHGPNGGCRCRKPALGMIEDALCDRPIDIANSWVVGDKKIDIETGFNGGMSTALVLTGYGERHLRELDRMPDVVADNILQAAREITGRGDQ
ncbi:MAG TPA: HAD family hydrolase [Pyrinomonadaceae bacterium]|jgi:D-glycero-D-manno-heptose 1,7-bisphosphate phosphatase